MIKESGRQSKMKVVLTALGVATLVGALATGLSWLSFIVSVWLMDSDD